MRQVLAMLVSATLLVVVGCSGKSYEIRLDKTLADMKYRDRLDRNLMPAPTKPKFDELQIFIRPPKSLELTKEPLLTDPDKTKFDLEAGFLEAAKQENMHVLARVKRAKAANTKTKKAEPPPPTRGDFSRDILALLNTYYNPPPELSPDKFKEDKQKTGNIFRKHVFSGNNKDVQVYLYTPKGNPYEVAIIFEYPKAEQAALSSKIVLCLESFATAEKARKAFSGTAGEEEGAATGAPGAGGGAAF